jgi:hypothetical protein
MTFRRLIAALVVGLTILLAVPMSCESHSAKPGGKTDTPCWYAPLEKAEWWQVIVATIGIGVIAWQAFLTRRSVLATQISAEATKKSVELQKAGMDQWIDTDSWRVGLAVIPPDSTQTMLPISFQIINPTKFKLTLTSITLWTDRRLARVMTFGSLLLPPGVGLPIDFNKLLEGVKLDMYNEGRLGFEIGGLIYFIDAFKEERKQLFGFLCNCNPINRAEFIRIAFNPPSDEEQRNQITQYGSPNA